MISEKQHRPIRSYVLRQGKMTPGQRNALETLWPQYGLDVEAGMTQRHGAILEIGFGNGESFLENARNNPNEQYIGVEVHQPGVGRLLMRAHEAGVTNFHVYNDDAIDVLTQCIPEDSLKAVLIFFPDPWHKKKHNKRRLIQASFVELIAKKLQQGGVLHIATDWEPYAEHIIEVMSSQTALVNTADDDLFVPRPDTRPLTKYEQRGQRLGHGVWDIVMKK